MESTLYVFLADVFFLACDHGQDFDISLLCDSIKMNQKMFPPWADSVIANFPSVVSHLLPGDRRVDTPLQFCDTVKHIHIVKLSGEKAAQRRAQVATCIGYNFHC